MSPDDPLPSMRQRLEGLAAFLPQFESPGFTIGQWDHNHEAGALPLFEFSEPAKRFMEAMYDLGWVLTDFDWPQWMGCREAKRLIGSPMP